MDIKVFAKLFSKKQKMGTARHCTHKYL